MPESLPESLPRSLPDSSHKSRQYDLIIIGGGLVGASLAAALAADVNTKEQCKIAVIEPFEADSKAQPSYDERTIALTLSSKNIFKQIGVWDAELESHACAIKNIHISNKGHFGISHLSHKDVQQEALGFVLPTRAIGQALAKQISKAKNVDFVCPYEAKTIKQSNNSESAELSIEHLETHESQVLSAKLLIIADGGRSPLLDAQGFVANKKAYEQSALLSIVSTNQAHHNKAYERFLKDGPLAMLPMTEQRYAVVWTLSKTDITRISALPDAAFLTELKQAFGTRAGVLSKPSARKVYPLNKSVLNLPYKPRLLALGNAAHTVHPVAGQGFNLGLRDVAALAELLDFCLDPSQNRFKDIGAVSFLAHYHELRTKDTGRVGQFTDGLLHIFRHPSPLVQVGRNLGLAMVENLPFIKRALLKRTMGLSQHQPRLARGLKLRRKG